MSLAHGYPRYDRAAQDRAAYALPAAEPARRPQTNTAAKPKTRRRSRGAVVAMATGWICLMAFAVLVIHRNSLILAESSAVTDIRAQLAQVQNQNQELEDKLTSQTSVEAVIAWAEAHDMHRAADIRTLEGVPTAVASAEEAAPEGSPADSSVAEDSTEGAPTGFWQSLKDRFAGMTQGAGAAPAQ